MSRNTTPHKTTVRAARFTSADHSEVELSAPFDGLPDNPRNGDQELSFYDADLYAKRQHLHGRAIYPQPEPFTDGRFKR